MFQKGGFVYIMCSTNRTTLYTGVTADLKRRVWEHKNKFYTDSFTSKYNCINLVYYNQYDTIEAAITEEKRIKGGSRNKKIALIESINKEWNDLWQEIDWCRFRPPNVKLMKE
jgi:putative endonuclease